MITHLFYPFFTGERRLLLSFVCVCGGQDCVYVVYGMFCSYLQFFAIKNIITKTFMTLIQHKTITIEKKRMKL